MNTNTIEKIVFKEEEYSKPKVLFGKVTDKGNFIEVVTTRGNTFIINKDYLIFRKAGGY